MDFDGFRSGRTGLLAQFDGEPNLGGDISWAVVVCRLWIGHYAIGQMDFGVASAFASGPHRTEQAAAHNAQRTSDEFVQEIVGSRR